MTTDRNDEQEAPERQAETEDDDAKGHVFPPAKSEDPDFLKGETSVYPPAASDDQTETNVKR